MSSESDNDSGEEVDSISSASATTTKRLPASTIKRKAAIDLTKLDEEEEQQVSEDDSDDIRSRLKNKKARVQKRWKPDSVDHCPEARKYLSKSPAHREIFDYIRLRKETQKGSNWAIVCMCCGDFERKGPTTLALDHFSEKGCTLKKAPNEEIKNGLKEHLADIAAQRSKKYARNLMAAATARLPNEDERRRASFDLEGYLKSSAVRQKVLLKEAAQMMIGCNLAPNIAENSSFRQFVHMVSGGKVTYSETEVLKRKALTKEMDAFSKEKCDKASAIFSCEAKQQGGTLIVDGWTAAKLIGTIGVSLCSMFTCYIMPVLLSGVERSRASDYVAKLECVVPWALMYFGCTDGASNMISFGEILKETKYMLPTLCAAHGFSLSVHYVGKVFEERSNMFSAVAGIIAFFNRSNQRLAYLREESNGVGFIKFCKTRMAYQTLGLMRLFRLRTAAKKAMISIEEQKMNDDDESIDPFSTFARVKRALDDDRLFKDVEIFCRVTLPILLAMREVDRGSPMAGFVYWLHYHVESQVKQILDKLVDADSVYARVRDDVMSALQFVWDKRHRPVLAFAYLTNPVFHNDLSKEEDVFSIDPSFREDVEDVLITMVKKRFSDQDVDIMDEYSKASNQLTAYLKPGALSIVQQHDAKTKLAADFWTSSSAVNKFPDLAFCARRVHAMPVVTSKLERFFSHVGNVQTEKRACLEPRRASLYAAAHQQMVESREPPSSLTTQQLLLELVRRCESLETEAEVFKFEKTPGFSELEEWVEGIRAGKLEMLYRRRSAQTLEAQDSSTEESTPNDSATPDGDGSAQEDTELTVTEQNELVAEYDKDFDDGVRRSGRARKPTRKLNL